MKIKIVGAAGGEVTGSAYFVQTERARVLVDAGMFQGGKKSEAKNRLPAGVHVSRLNAVLLTHAHLDHTGRVPLLIKRGYARSIFATAATIELAELILQDAARLQIHDAERINRKRNFSQQGPVEALYSPEDVAPFKQMATAVPFGEPVQVADGISARWIEAGHILGSASIELTVTENGRSSIILFSGDLGPMGRQARDSQSLNDIEGPCLILAGAGMCNGGRILHHLRHGLPRENTHVLIVGYQTQGSLGRRLVERAKSVSVFGDKISVRAKVNTLGGFSAHAGQSDLLKWITPLAPSRPRIIITHGEDTPRKTLAAIIHQRFGLVSQLPSQGNTVEISEPVIASHAMAS